MSSGMTEKNFPGSDNLADGLGMKFDLFDDLNNLAARDLSSSASSSEENQEAGINATAKAHHRVMALADYFVRVFFYRIFTGKFSEPGLKVTKILSKDRFYQYLDRPSFSFNAASKLYYNTDATLLLSYSWNGRDYEFVSHAALEDDPDNMLKHFHYLTCMSQGEMGPDEMLLHIFETALKHSPFRNSIILFEKGSEKGATKSFVELLEVITPGDIPVRSLFIPAEKKEEVERFIYAVRNFKTDGINLRFLLNGPPGTGKTQLMRAVANRLQGEATILLAQGSDGYLPEIFRFCGLFKPCVLIIDDLDLVVGSRETEFNKDKLGFLLQQLDGFLPNSIFILASTNDKNLVDMAASRPGRFDLIMDIAEMNDDNYLELVKRETDDKEIINLFSEETMKNMKSKKVTGAFIVSLVKQLISRKKMNGSVSQAEMNTMFDMQHRGFYSTNSKTITDSFGFNG